MKVFTDLHLHSCLSPCADDEMIPWNIVGMASIKEMDVIALTDHNSALNLPDAVEAGRELGVQVMPGLEVTSREEVHMLAYFCKLEDAMAFGEMIYDHLPDVKNNAALFGRQIIMENGDTEKGELEKLLISATDFSVEQLTEQIHAFHGVAVPAHINRGSNGMLGALGLMPMLPLYPVVEVAAKLDCPAYATKGRLLLHSSDAHRLEDMQERVFSLEVAEPTVQAVWEWLREKTGGG